MDSEKEELLSTSDLSPVLVPNLAHLARPDLLPCTSTPIIETLSASPDHHLDHHVEHHVEHHLEPDRNESRHHSISLSLHHSGSRHSLASRSLTTNQEKKEREARKEARKAQSAQLPAHGEVQKMEASLLKLLNEFNSGQLRAFDSAYSLEEMESVRDKQEAIARKHFELGAAQDLHPPLSDEVSVSVQGLMPSHLSLYLQGLAMGSQNMTRLMDSLEELSQAIGQLSCLDRMLDRGGRNIQPDLRDGSQMSFSQSEEKPLRISRRSTMSNTTETTNLPESEYDTSASGMK